MPQGTGYTPQEEAMLQDAMFAMVQRGASPRDALSMLQERGFDVSKINTTVLDQMAGGVRSRLQEGTIGRRGQQQPQQRPRLGREQLLDGLLNPQSPHRQAVTAAFGGQITPANRAASTQALGLNPAVSGGRFLVPDPSFAGVMTGR